MNSLDALRLQLQQSDSTHFQAALKQLQSRMWTAMELMACFELGGQIDAPEKLRSHLQGYPHANRLYAQLIFALIEARVAWVLELASLDLSRCGLDTLPTALQDLHKLQQLDLSFNAIPDFSVLSEMGELQHLKLQGNPFSPSHLSLFLEQNAFELETALMNVVDVPGGTFLMGSPSAPKEITITRSLRVMATTVTEQIYAFGMKESCQQHQNLPKRALDWYEVVCFANSLSLRLGLEPAYTINRYRVDCNFDAEGWRLPTEAEWEYLARAGQSYRYAGSDDYNDCAWFAENSERTVQAVALKRPNAFGLYDMSGNVWEWAWNLNYAYSEFPASDPVGPERKPNLPPRGQNRMARGGSAQQSAASSDLSVRRSIRIITRPDLGFRLVRSLKP